MQIAFHCPAAERVWGAAQHQWRGGAALLASISGSGLGIKLQIIDATSIDGLIAAYTSAAPDGGERIYLNASWLELATPEQIEAVLLEELGHAIDHRLNGISDSAGDEGAIFSALLRGKTPDPEAFRDNDQRILSIDGVTVAVEASIDITRPAGSLGNFAERPSFSLEGRSDEPFGLPHLGNTGAASPTIADVDGDGDLDLFIGTRWGNTYFFRNIAVAGATDPAFNAGNKRNWIVPSGIERVQSPNLELFPDRNANPILADIDDDGDFDLFIGNRYGYIHFFRNTGSASTPTYTQEGGDNPFGIPQHKPSSTLRVINNIVTYHSRPRPAFGDIDGDGDLDLFLGDSVGNTLFFRNTGSASNPAFIREGGNNPFGITQVQSQASPTLADVDADGDLDLFIGNSSGNTLFFRNTGSSSTPAYTREGGNTPLRFNERRASRQPGFLPISTMMVILISSLATLMTKFSFTQHRSDTCSPGPSHHR